jgi:hypothetical protein
VSKLYKSNLARFVILTCAAFFDTMNASFLNLEKLLEQRLQIIADHAALDRDPVAHMDQLKSVSEALLKEHEALRGKLPAQLNHFMTQASYSKALDFIRGSQG